ncbi:MAG: UDP-N-acetylmuramoyl-tripeptide--D-alanyl-D-alanine ligase [Oscillospiraceae bacterium]|jgi:UDP-N-acetylmuramoyl-tripeptide--D-alanyl-D-alanine ligase|nr:UDP-N-acetylmuramoyl-tripeptide--D-alanyl-D-alanine ligase [Oscillospiraceae bacterium]
MGVVPYTVFALCGVSAGGAALALRYLAHMFQLNTYKPNVQRQWARANARALRRLWIPVIGGWFFRPKPAKKPLVYTPRMKRLLVVAALPVSLCVAGAAVALALEAQWPAFGLSLAVLLFAAPFAPQILLLANRCNAPAEQTVRNYYTKQAVRKLRAHTKLITVGITGSYGKTSMKYCLNALLRVQYNVFMTPEGTNTPMGVVRCVREGLSAAHAIFLCEMGAKNVGDIRELCDLVQPQCGVLTSVGPQHLESFHSLENVVKTKFELADALPDDPASILFVNAEDESIRAQLENYGQLRTVRYAAAPGFGADYWAENVTCGENGVTFTARTARGESAAFATRLLGRHNVLNLMGAVAVAHTFGVPLTEMRGAIRKLAPVPHRLELLDKGGTLIIDDAYNSNPGGAKAALDALALFADRQKILITPGMIELGTRQAELNKTFGAQAAAVCDAIALVGAAQTEPIRQGVLEAGFAPDQCFTAQTLQDALQWANALPNARQKIILLENDLPDNFGG